MKKILLFTLFTLSFLSVRAQNPLVGKPSLKLVFDAAQTKKWEWIVDTNNNLTINGTGGTPTITYSDFTGTGTSLSAFSSTGVLTRIANGTDGQILSLSSGVPTWSANNAVPTTRTLTIAGTANEITSSAGAQDLSANRTWTLSLPSSLTFTGKTITGGAFTGGAINNAVIGGTTPAAGTFTAGIFNEDVNRDATAGTSRGYFLRTGTSRRWGIIANSDAESGSNAGANFRIAAYDDTGTFLRSDLSISRSTGAASFSGTVAGAFNGTIGGTTPAAGSFTTGAFGDAVTITKTLGSDTPGTNAALTMQVDATRSFAFRQGATGNRDFYLDGLFGGTWFNYLSISRANGNAVFAGTVSGSFNGSLGATTPSTVAATSLAIGLTSPSLSAHISYNSANTTLGANTDGIRITNRSTTANTLSEIQFSGTSNTTLYGAISGALVDGTNNTRGDIVVSTRRVSTDANLTETIRFNEDGNVNINSGALQFGGTTAISSTRAATLTTASLSSSTSQLSFGTTNPVTISVPSSGTTVTHTMPLLTSNSTFALYGASAATRIPFWETEGATRLTSSANFTYNSSTSVLAVTGNSNIGLGGSTFGTSATNTFAIVNGTAPTTSPANLVQLYAEDVAASSELKVRDEAGNITVLGPHSFIGIPEGRSEEMAWAFYSERDGQYINVDMAKAIRTIEQQAEEIEELKKMVYELAGKKYRKRQSVKLVHIGKVENVPNPKNK